jgi:hypothetical protein
VPHELPRRHKLSVKWTTQKEVFFFEWLRYYNEDRTHQGKMCCGRTPMQTLINAKERSGTIKLQH